MLNETYIKGRGAQEHISNRFSALQHEMRDDFLNYCQAEGEKAIPSETSFMQVFPRTIVNKVSSPDVGMQYSANPYQGCEHGCVYCYARNSHEYWGYDAALDFEQKILFKPNAPQLLAKKLTHRNWEAHPIVLSGNTDCYQPIEKKLQITRRLLKTFLRYKHPVGIITKNSLILRDLDILKELAKDRLVSVYISITTLDEKTRRVLEPRTATITKRFQTVETLNANNIPTSVMMAPIIPAINSHEILPLVKEASNRGAKHVGYTIVRLNGALGQIFSNWLSQTYPDRKDKVLKLIKECHGGSLNDTDYGKRMIGSGAFAEQIKQQFEIAINKYLPDTSNVQLNCNLHQFHKNNQLSLF